MFKHHLAARASAGASGTDTPGWWIAPEFLSHIYIKTDDPIYLHYKVIPPIRLPRSRTLTSLKRFNAGSDDRGLEAQATSRLAGNATGDQLLRLARVTTARTRSPPALLPARLLPALLSHTRFPPDLGVDPIVVL
ncbi:C6 transcription factor [Aspergillus luchuensis]|uniref:C6 transcription factor n=1 Tax=Aspergillus kawachii TaxID=1069201 RepID=A0A146FS89_ASPKA|nr:C6 transcription factor [Aspergillus luchuensis]